jgi:hypothetical protein
MGKFLNKKSAVLATVIAVVMAVAAYAYLTVDGAGSGTGSASASNPDLALSIDAPQFTQLDQEKTVKVWATNSGDNPARLRELTVNVDESTLSDCPDGSYTVKAGSKSLTTNQVPAKTTIANKVEVGSVTIKFNNVNAEQAPCLTAENGNAPKTLAIGLNGPANPTVTLPGGGGNEPAPGGLPE